MERWRKSARRVGLASERKVVEVAKIRFAAPTLFLKFNKVHAKVVYPAFDWLMSHMRHCNMGEFAFG